MTEDQFDKLTEHICENHTARDLAPYLIDNDRKDIETFIKSCWEAIGENEEDEE